MSESPRATPVRTELDRADPERAIAAAAERLSNSGRWGADDELGTLNFLTEDKRRDGASLVRRGVSFSLAQPFNADGPPSRNTWVRAGDLLGAGISGNGGCLAELWGRRGELSPAPLRPGDVAEMTVEGIGTIPNQVVADAGLPPVRPARPRPRIRKCTP